VIYDEDSSEKLADEFARRHSIISFYHRFGHRYASKATRTIGISDVIDPNQDRIISRRVGQYLINCCNFYYISTNVLFWCIFGTHFFHYLNCPY
jgi:hypothetical protein